MVADVNLVLVEATALIAEDEQSVSTEGLLLDRPRLWHDLYTANGNFFLSAVLAHVPYRGEESHVHLRCRTLGAERRNFVFLTN